MMSVADSLGINEADIMKRLRVSEGELEQEALQVIMSVKADLAAAIERAEMAEKQWDALSQFKDWVDSFVSNPASSYSVAALDGIFGMTRDKSKAIDDHAS